MAPILLCSVVAFAISLERLWSLRISQIMPEGVISQVAQWMKKGSLSKSQLQELRNNSPFGQILAAGLINAQANRETMKSAMDEQAGHVVHDMERYLSTLGTIAAIAPLLGLLGTVIGMIKVFAAIMAHGTGDAAVLAGGISEALVTTAAGLSVAIPSLIFHRFLTRRIDELSIRMENQAVKLVDAVHGGKQVKDS